MSTAETIRSLPDRPMPNGDPATWVYLNDLPAPLSAAEEVERTCREHGWGRFSRWWHKRHLATIVRQMKRVHYFWGKQIIFQRTRRGDLILYVGELGDDLLAYWKSLPNDPDRFSRLSVSRGNFPGYAPPENNADEA